MQWHDDSARFPRFQFLPPGEPPRRSHLFQGGDPTKVEGGMRGVPPHSTIMLLDLTSAENTCHSDCDMNLGCNNNFYILEKITNMKIIFI